MFGKVKKSNLILICFSFFLAVLLWAYIGGEQAVEVTRIVPLTIETQKDMVVVSDEKTMVRVRLSVPGHLLGALKNESIEVIHKAGKIKEPGRYSFDLKPTDVKRPSAMIKVVQIVPERIVVSVDQVIEKRLPIKVNLVNEPAAGFKIDEARIQVDPNAVLVAGAEAVLEKTEHVFTEPIDIIGRIRSFRKKVVLENNPAYSIVNKSLIDIFVPIKEQYVSKSYEKINILVLRQQGSAYQISTEPTEITLHFQGSKIAMEDLQLSSILAYVDVKDLGIGRYQLPLQVDVPEGVILKDANPIIEVNIEASRLQNVSKVLGGESAK